MAGSYLTLQANFTGLPVNTIVTAMDNGDATKMREVLQNIINLLQGAGGGEYPASIVVTASTGAGTVSPSGIPANGGPITLNLT